MDVALQRPTWSFAPLSQAFTAHCRAKRVILLLLATALMGVGDLALTLTFLTSTGMVEANPIARSVMEHGSTSFIVLWKLATMALGLGILFWARRTRGAEAAAWFCFVVMTALSFHWFSYATTIKELDHDEAVLIAGVEEPGYVNIP